MRTGHAEPQLRHRTSVAVRAAEDAAAIADRTARRLSLHDLLQEAQPWDGPCTSQQLRSWRHITLTTRASDDIEARFEASELRRRVLEVRGAASRFWRKTVWGAQKRDQTTGNKRARRDTSYVLAVEVARRGMVHAHMLVFGEYVPKARLEALWADAIGEPAFIFVQTVRGSEGVAAAVRETLKYATKGEKDLRTQAEHAAAVEIAFRNVKRVSIGGALRRVHSEDQPKDCDDGLADDLHAKHALVCIACGLLGEWSWGGVVYFKATDL